MAVQIRHQRETSCRVKVGTDFRLRKRNATREQGRRRQPLQRTIETSRAEKRPWWEGEEEEEERGICEMAPSELLIAESSNSPITHYSHHTHSPIQPPNTHTHIPGANTIHLRISL